MAVSWGRAFRTALMIILFSIVWVIVGGVIMFVGGGLSIAGGIAGDSPIGAIAGAVASYIIGLLIIVFGVSATQLKFTAELYADEIEKRVRSSGAAPPPPQ